MNKSWKPVLIKVAKIAGIVLGIYVLVLVIISIYITSSEERLINTIKSKAEESVLGELTIQKAGLTVWHSFPKISLTLSGVRITDSVFHEPVIKAKSIDVKVGLLDLIGDKVEINSVKLNDATVHFFTRKNGYTNSYIFKPKNKKKVKSKKAVVINNLAFNNVVMISENAIKNKRYEVRFKTLDADINLSNGIYNIKLEENALIRGLGFNMAKGYWLENQTVVADWNIKFDTAKKMLSAEKTDVKINGQPFEIGATFFLDAAKPHFRLDAKTKQIPLNKALAILKPTTSAKIAKIDLKKPLDVSITLDGSLAYRTVPLVLATWETKNNILLTPVTNLDSVTFSGNFTNRYNDSLPFGDENSHVHFNLFTAKWGGITLTAKQVALTNLKVPDLQFVFFSSTTLPQLNESLSSNALSFTAGRAKLFISYKGPIVADPALLNRLNAQINLSNGQVVYKPTNMTFTECNGVITLYNNNLYINNLTGKLNNSKITVNARGKNLNRISEDEEGKAFIQCYVTSPLLNLNDLKKLFGSGASSQANDKAKTATAASPLSQVDNALENGTLVMNMKVNEVVSNHFKATDVITSVSFTHSDWQINKIYMKHAGGTLNLTGIVKRSSLTMHNANVNLDVNKMSISQVMYAFDNFGMQSMTSNNIKGILTMKSNLIFSISNDGNMLPGTMNGNLDLSVKKGALLNFQPVMDIKKFAFKNRDLSNIEFEEIKDKFDIKNGNVYIHRMPVQSSAFLIYVEGVYSVKDETNIAIQVPIKTIFKKPDYDTKALSTDKGGASIWLRARSANDGSIKIGLDVFKKLRNDKYEDVISN